LNGLTPMVYCAVRFEAVIERISMENKNPLVSIIVPIYNVEHYLKRCIDSILMQSYANIQIILVNDGSTDSSGDICEQYKREDNRIKYLLKPNGGLSDARNYGIRHADGDYYMFVDSDDYIHPQMVELLLSSLIQRDADITVCDYKKVSENEIIAYDSYEKDYAANAVKEFDRFSSVKELFGGEKYVRFTVAWNKLYKRKLFENIEYPVGKIHEDEFTAYRLLFNSNRVIYIDIPLYYYCQRSGSIMKSPFSEKRFDKAEAYRERCDFFISEGVFEKEAVKSYLLYYIQFLKKFKKAFPSSNEKYHKYYHLLAEEFYRLRNKMGLRDQLVMWCKIFHPRVFKFIKRVAKHIGQKKKQCNVYRNHTICCK